MKKKETKFKETEIGAIPEEWDILSVSDVAIINEKVLSNKNMIDINYLDIASVESGRIIGLQKMNLSVAPSRARRILRDNDIVISTVRPNLKHYAFIRNAQENLIGSTGFAVVTSKKINPIFLYFSLTTDAVTEYLSGIAASQTSTYPAINPDAIENLPIAVPSEAEQIKIAEILSSLDDKIELNRKISANLEKIASMLFRQWFVDFEFPNESGQSYKSSGGKMIDSELGEIPEGWKISDIGDVINIVYGKGLPMDKLLPKGHPVFGGNGVIGFFEKYLYEEPQIIVGCRGAGSGNIKQTYPKSFVTNNSLVLEIPKGSAISRFYLKQFLQKVDVTEFVTGSAQPQITIENLKHLKILIPDAKVLNLFAEFSLSLDQMSFNNELENKNLSALRDSLLPRLISGKIRVKV